MLPGGEMVEADSPVMQVRSNYHGLVDELQKCTAAPKYIYGSYALIFPDISTVLGGLGPMISKEMIGFSDDFPLLGEKVTTMMKSRLSGGQQTSLGEAGAEAIVQCLLPYTVAEPKLSEDLKVKEKEIEKLTKRQETVLDYLVNILQALISGGAGTGKNLSGRGEGAAAGQTGEKGSAYPSMISEDEKGSECEILIF